MSVLAFLHSGLALFAAGDSDSSGGLYPLFLLLGGPIFYGVMYSKYRNTGARHHHETETASTKLDVVRSDELVESLQGLSNPRMHGANNTSVSGSGGFFGTADPSAGILGSLNSLVGQIEASATNGGAGTTPVGIVAPPPAAAPPASRAPAPSPPAPSAAAAPPPPPAAPPAAAPAPPPAAPPGPGDPGSGGRSF